jgi:hypothetical protein
MEQINTLSFTVQYKTKWGCIEAEKKGVLGISFSVGKEVAPVVLFFDTSTGFSGASSFPSFLPSFLPSTLTKQVYS